MTWAYREVLVNERQYRCLRESRRLRGPLRLGDVSPRGRGRPAVLAQVLASAAKKLRRREAGVLAWGRVAKPRWLAETVVDVVDGDALVIAASSSTMCYELRRHRAELEREITKLVPGVHRLRFVVAAVHTPRARGYSLADNLRPPR